MSLNDVSDPNTYPNGNPFDIGENDLLLVSFLLRPRHVIKDLSFTIYPLRQHRYCERVFSAAIVPSGGSTRAYDIIAGVLLLLLSAQARCAFCARDKRRDDGAI